MERSIKQYPEMRQWLTPTERLLARAEIAHLPKVLWKDEVPDFAAQGIYSGGICLIVPTNLRLILIDQKFFDLKIDGFSYARIDTVEFDRGLIFGWMNLMLPGRTVELRYLRRRSVTKICEIINEHVTRHHNYVSASAVPQSVIATVEPEPSMEVIINQLERLVLLRQAGGLTELEFFQQKERILKTQPHAYELQRQRARSPHQLGAGREFIPEED